MFRHTPYMITFYIMIQFNGTIGNFGILHPIFIKNTQIILKLIPDKKSFKKCTSKIDRYPGFFIGFYFFPQIRRNIGCAPAELNYIYIVTPYT